MLLTQWHETPEFVAVHPLLGTWDYTAGPRKIEAQVAARTQSRMRRLTAQRLATRDPEIHRQIKAAMDASVQALVDVEDMVCAADRIASDEAGEPTTFEAYAVRIRRPPPAPTEPP